MIKVKALALIVRPADGALLVSEGEDGSSDGFARMLGGHVEFGELAVDALRREFREELDCDVADISLVTVMENRFVLNGVAGHEVIFVFGCDLADASLYEREAIPILDVPGLEAVWWSPRTHRSRLVPAGLSAVIDQRRRA
jgi:ADP-ribose pyrophosphatase YjhB (NUDIX family)